MDIPAQVYDFSDADVEYVITEVEQLLSNRRFLTLGDKVEEFESAFAAAHDMPLGVATNSGTAALEAILRAVDVAGGEVIVPTNTFAATGFAVLRGGARPVFADIQDDMTIDVGDVVRCLSPATRAVITVHVGGLISPSTSHLARLCDEAGVALVEDAAHAHGSAVAGRAAGGFGLAAAFSFFSTKVITTGEGGMVLTGDLRVAEVARLLRDQAKVSGENRHDVVGYNWRLSELHAILGLAQVRRLDEFVRERQRVASQYDRLLADVDGIEAIPVPEGVVHNRYKYTALLDDAAPSDLKANLKGRHGIALAGYVYDVPLHRQPVFREFADRDLRTAEDLCARHVCLPIYPSLTDQEAEFVVDAIRLELAALRA